MKYNRIGILMLVLLTCGLFAGCASIQELSEEQEDLVAEYSAGVLLRYSDRYELRLITKDQTDPKKEENATNSPEETATPQPSEKPTPTPETEEDVTKDSETDEEEKGAENRVSLSEIYKDPDLEVSYVSYEFCSKYPKKAKGAVSPTIAGEGQVLFVVNFDVKNVSKDSKRVQFGKRGIQYTLSMGGEEYQPGISILENMGMNYLDATIPSGKTESAALIYTVSKEKKNVSDISLTVQDGDRTSEIKIK